MITTSKIYSLTGLGTDIYYTQVLCLLISVPEAAYSSLLTKNKIQEN